MKDLPRICFVGLLFALAALPGTAQPKHLNVDGDPGAHMPLAASWKPEPVVRNDAGLVISAPIWSTYWANAGQLAPEDSRVPIPPRALLKQEVPKVLAWGAKEYELEPIVIATPNAVLVFSLKSMPAKAFSAEERGWLQGHFTQKLKKKLTPAQVAHALGLRYLRLEQMWRELLCLDAKEASHRPARLAGHFGSKGRSELYVFPKDEPYREFGRHFFGAAGQHASYWWHGETEVIIGAFHAGELKHGEFLARFDHIVAHDLVYQYRAFYHYLPAWVPNGIAHHFARRNKEVRSTYILLGAADSAHQAGWKWDEGGARRDWWREAKALVRAGDQQSITKLGMSTHYQELPPRAHVQAWSMVNYMIGMGKDRFRTFMDEMKSKSEDESLLEVQQRAFLRAYGVNMVVFERNWKRWVSKTRPPKRRRG
ncbi:MAG: hypothetical protein CMJ90_14640 [Planctomycetes bacterium]|nr:hypothetical protein [Planctomycetota bacterium]